VWAQAAGEDSVSLLDPARPEHAYLLESVHAALMQAPPF